jgi:uncharacterized membrane protein
MLLNLAVVVIFLIALWQGWANDTNSVGVWLSVLGVIVLGVSGWLGGKLTFIGRVGAVEEQGGSTPTVSGTAAPSRETIRTAR